MRQIMFVTGIRSEYDIQYSVMKAVNDHPELDLKLIVTGPHLSPLYGFTISEIERDGFPITARIESLLNSDSPSGRIKSAAIQLAGLVDVMATARPDFVVAPFDREEAITTALAGSFMAIPVVHIGGGDIAGDENIDNSIRHAVTKLSHLHMVTTELSRQRILSLGEEAWRIHVVGAPGLDRLVTTPELPDQKLWDRLDCDPGEQPFVLVIQHATLSTSEQAGEQMRTTLESIISLDLKAFVSYPNSDSGSQQIISVIDEYTQLYPDLIHKYKNLPRLEFVNLLRRASALVGNSSCGIIEAPLFHLPVVNIGERQQGREHAENIQFVPHTSSAIRYALQRAVFDQEYRQAVCQCTNPYGDGHAGEHIAEVLARIPVDSKLICKKSTF